jgi:phenylpropionate dioxygenase-like ring-hydroxylating dioxygenase large terminal subunit
MATPRLRSLTQPYSAYYYRDVPAPDPVLTQVGPGTPCGEYFRRFWQPVGKSSDLGDLPRRVRVLGEDLVLFRDGSGRAGLLQLHCSHRGASLEFGIVSQRGIRCCYHGWLYDVDGRILETPGEPPESTFKDRLYHGAYPARECHGLAFAYLGPPDRQPEFPLYDTFEMPGYEVELGPSYLLPCNWLQVKENSMDPAHTVFLHSTVSGTQFADAYAELGVLDWQDTPMGMLGIHTRRVGDLVWMHLTDFLAPNIHQFPRAAEIDDEKPFIPPQATVWAVPVDDTATRSFRLQYMRPGAPQARLGANFGQDGDRPYEERQRKPGDYDAQTAQRPIAVHALEHLGSTDRGVTMFRKAIREGIEAVERGEDPRGVVRIPGAKVRTSARSTVLRRPPAPTPEADRELLRRTAREIIAAIRPAPHTIQTPANVGG